MVHIVVIDYLPVDPRPGHVRSIDRGPFRGTKCQQADADTADESSVGRTAGDVINSVGVVLPSLYFSVRSSASFATILKGGRESGMKTMPWINLSSPPLRRRVQTLLLRIRRKRNVASMWFARLRCVGQAARITQFYFNLTNFSAL